MITKLEENKSIPVNLQYAYTKDIEAFTINNNTLLLSFFSGKEWQQFDFTLFTLKLNTKFQKSFYGLLPITSLTFSLLGDDIDVQNSISNLLNAKLIFKITFSDGQKKTIGTPQKPSFISNEFNNELLPENTFNITTNQQQYFYSEIIGQYLDIGTDEILLISDTEILTI